MTPDTDALGTVVDRLTRVQGQLGWVQADRAELEKLFPA